LLSLARSIPEAATAVREGKWPRIHGKLLAGKTIGLIGFGAIGREVAQRLQTWDTTLLVFDPFADQGRASALSVELVPLDDLSSRSDFLLLHAPLLPETRHMINESLLSRTKKGVYIVNAARGELIDEHALLAALNSGHIAGAALDAFAEEPPPSDSPLRMHPKVIATPHCGAHTDGAVDSMGWQSFEDCIAVLRGEAPHHPVRNEGVSQ
jgi:D-3-phosphoglycerate dehydrogenase